MGLLRTISTAVLGPLALYGLLLAHVGYRFFLETPPPLEVQEFPRGTSDKEIEAIKAARQPLLRATMDALGGKPAKDYADKFTADDVEFEDFTAKWAGREEFDLLLSAASNMIANVDYTIHGEHHAPHEIVMEWSMLCTAKGAMSAYPMSITMRTHILLEPPSKAGGQEKIFRIFEEWNNNKQLNEKTTTIPILGKVHRLLRRFHGYLFASSVRAGYM